LDQAFREHNENFEFQNYDLVCNKLQKANASIFIIGNAGVMSGRSYGWVTLSVADKDNYYLSTPFGGYAQTAISGKAHSKEARVAIWSALNAALNEWPENGVLDDALASLEKARQSIRKPATQR